MGAHPVATRDRILASAEDAFGREGFERTRLEAVAEGAGIRRPSLLYHFPTKEALYQAVVGRTFAGLGGALAGAMRAAGNHAEKVEAVTRTFQAFIDSRPHTAAIVLREFVDGRPESRRVLLRAMAPVLDAVEAFPEREGPSRFPARQAILQVAAGVLLRAAAGPLRGPLWGSRNDTVRLARKLFAEESG